MPSTTDIKLSEADVQNCTWEITEITPEYRRSIGRGTHPVTGVPIVVQKTEFIAEPELLAQNQSDRNESDNKRWSSGIGSDKGGNLPLVPVGRIPLNKFFAELAPRLKEGDRDHAKWWLERDENQPFRTRRGRL